MRRKLRQGLLLVAATLVGLLAPQAGADIVLDTFSGSHAATDSVFFGSPDALGVTSTSVYDVNVFSGYRDLFVRVNDPAINQLSLVVDGGASFNMHYSSQAPEFIAPDVAHITWDGLSVPSNGGTPNYSTASDLLAAGSFFSLTSNTWTTSRYAALQVWEAGAVEESKTVQFELLGTATTHNIAFSSFAGIDFTNVGAIRLHFLTDELEFREFSVVSTPTGPLAPVVPVPPAVALGALGMLAVAGARRRSSANIA